MQNLSTDILIVGAGPTGLLLAIELATFGTDFLIISKDEDKPWNSGALVIHAATLELFSYLGLLAEVLKDATPVDRIGVKTEKKNIKEILLGEMVTEPVNYPPLILLEQYKLERILIQWLANMGKQVLKGTLEGISYEEGHVIAAVSNNGNINYSVKARYLVGADGKNSTTRELMSFTKKKYRVGNPIFIIDFEGTAPAEPGEIVFYFVRHGSFGLFPLKSGFYRMDGALDQNYGQQLTIEKVKAHLPGEIKIEKINWFSVFYGNYLLCDDFNKGRVFLAGDAAHTHNPVGGQGMNSGFQDAHNLAWKMHMVINGKAYKALLDTYNAERRPVVKKIMDASTFIFKYAAGFNIAPSYVRLKLLPLFSGLLKRLSTGKYGQKFYKAVSQLWVRHSALSPDINHTLVKYRVGQLFRFHDFPMPSETTNSFILLVFLNSLDNNAIPMYTDPVKADILLLKPYPVKVYTIHKSAENEGLYQRLSINRSVTFLLRPDYYIAMINEGIDVKPIAGYFSNKLWQGY